MPTQTKTVYFALGIDRDGDVVTNSVADSNKLEAADIVVNDYEDAKIFQIIEVVAPVAQEQVDINKLPVQKIVLKV